MKVVAFDVWLLMTHTLRQHTHLEGVAGACVCVCVCVYVCVCVCACVSVRVPVAFVGHPTFEVRVSDREKHQASSCALGSLNTYIQMKTQTQTRTQTRTQT